MPGRSVSGTIGRRGHIAHRPGTPAGDDARRARTRARAAARPRRYRRRGLAPLLGLARAHANSRGRARDRSRELPRAAPTKQTMNRQQPKAPRQLRHAWFSLRSRETDQIEVNAKPCASPDPRIPTRSQSGSLAFGRPGSHELTHPIDDALATHGRTPEDRLPPAGQQAIQRSRSHRPRRRPNERLNLFRGGRISTAPATAMATHPLAQCEREQRHAVAYSGRCRSATNRLRVGR